MALQTAILQSATKEEKIREITALLRQGYIPIMESLSSRYIVDRLKSHRVRNKEPDCSECTKPIVRVERYFFSKINNTHRVYHIACAIVDGYPIELVKRD